MNSPFANVFVNDLELKLAPSFGTDILDFIFSAWPGNVPKLNLFLQLYNSFYHNLYSTLDIGHQQISFLDLFIHISQHPPECFVLWY